MTQPNYLDVSIMGREYRVACSPEEREALLAAVAHVDERMREIATRSSAATPERVAVMAALNIAHDALSTVRNRPEDGAPTGVGDVFDNPDARRRMVAMAAQLDSVLGKRQDQLFD